MKGRSTVPAIPFTDTPPPPPGWYPIFRPASGETRSFVALSGEVAGALLHYFQCRSIVCIGKEQGCKLCRGQGTHWEGYLFGFSESEKRVFIVALTAGAVRNCWGVRAGLLQRGRKFTVKRDEKGPNARVTLVIHESVSYADKLPPSPDLRDCLSRLWGVGLAAAFGPDGTASEAEDHRDAPILPHTRKGADE